LPSLGAGVSPSSVGETIPRSRTRDRRHYQGAISRGSAASDPGVGGRWQAERQRSKASVLRNVPIRSRFVFTLIVPLLGLAVLAVGGIRSDLAERARAARVHQLARFGADLGPVIHQLQDERSLSSNYLAVGPRTGAADLATERRAVDRVVAAYRAAVAGCAWARARRPCEASSLPSRARSASSRSNVGPSTPVRSREPTSG
jgi:Nitrate and nitrite sensing